MCVESVVTMSAGFTGRSTGGGCNSGSPSEYLWDTTKWCGSFSRRFQGVFIQKYLVGADHVCSMCVRLAW